MHSTKAKKIFLISIIIILTSFVYGMLEALIKSPSSIPRNWPWGYFYAAIVTVIACLIIYYSLKKYNLLSTKFAFLRLLAFFIIWIAVEDFSYWITEKVLLPFRFQYPFPVQNWWQDYFPLIGTIVGRPFLFNIPTLYFLAFTIFIIYLIWEFKIVK